jgi:hypothetical protein
MDKEQVITYLKNWQDEIMNREESVTHSGTSTELYVIQAELDMLDHIIGKLEEL